MTTAPFQHTIPYYLGDVIAAVPELWHAPKGIRESLGREWHRTYSGYGFEQPATDFTASLIAATIPTSFP
jgi:hypothetical protein